MRISTKNKAKATTFNTMPLSREWFTGGECVKNLGNGERQEQPQLSLTNDLPFQGVPFQLL
jgi:hypothetical protein